MEKLIAKKEWKPRPKMVTRAYHAQVVPNFGKSEIALYAIDRYEEFCRHFAGKTCFSDRKYSTAGMGETGNKALHFCREQASKLKKSHAALKKEAERVSKKKSKKILKYAKPEKTVKWNVPTIRPHSVELLVPIEKSRNSFDFWISVPNLWTKGKTVRIPIKSHKAINNALKNGFSLTNFAKIKRSKDGKLNVIIHVHRLKKETVIPTDCLGVDVGIRRAIGTSDGFIGKDMRPILKAGVRTNSERYRQRTVHKQEIPYKKKRNETRSKQELNRYAQSLIRRSKKLGLGIAVESPRVMANLKSGNLQGWGRCTLARRLLILGKENGVFVVEVNPANTSQKCHCCRAFGERDEIIFTCTNVDCALHMVAQDAEVNAGLNIQIEGRVALGKIALAVASRNSGTRTSAVRA